MAFDACDNDAAKPAQCLRIDDVKGQAFMAETIQDFDDGTTQHLIGAHTVGTGSPGWLLSFVQILQNSFADGRLGADDGADRLHFLALSVVGDVGNQGHMLAPFFAHFVSGSFTASCCYFGWLSLSSILLEVKTCQH